MRGKRREIELHSAGATVRHRSPFSDLDVPKASGPLSAALRDRWVIPLYMLHPSDPDIRSAILARKAEMAPWIITDLLAQFNWRPRTVGAYLAGIWRRTEFEVQLGRLLLRSDVCYAGRAYCLALALFNTSHSIDVLTKYLDYYLGRPDLSFDQRDALAALLVLDDRNETDLASAFDEAWHRFVADETLTKLDGTVSRFRADLTALERLADEIGE